MAGRLVLKAFSCTVCPGEEKDLREGTGCSDNG